ncbi:MAG: YqgE/AlgH family protein, partial [Ferruginibacter sp.]
MDAPIPLQDQCLLVADPFLQDDHFTRTVIFLMSHMDQEGSFGLILNKQSPYRLHELFDAISRDDLIVMEGGPVGSDTLHFLHRCPNLIPDGQAMSDTLFWGGDFEAVQSALEKNQLSPADIRFFL